jgi:hypothetical protein
MGEALAWRQRQTLHELSAVIEARDVTELHGAAAGHLDAAGRRRRRAAGRLVDGNIESPSGKS